MARVVVAYATLPAHDLLRAEAARFHELPPSRVVLGHECVRCGSTEHGRPRLLATAALRVPARVSLARAGALSVVALTDAGDVGVDVEPSGAAEFEGFDAVARHPSEGDADRTRTWVRKEAVLKACGVGLAVDPARLRLDEHVVGAWPPELPMHGRTLLHDVPVPGHVCSVAVVVPDGDPVDGLDVTVRRASG